MNNKEYSPKEISKLTSKKGLVHLLQNSKQKLNTDKTLRYLKYEKRLEDLQVELLQMQKWVKSEGKKVIIVFEGRDAAGKGGALRRITEHLPPREHRVVALPKPNLEEQGHWYFERYIKQFPNKGEIVFFDRSWYNRAIVEPVNGFCTQKEYQIFMDQVVDLEKMMLQSDIILLKLYFSITKNEQEKRFKEIQASPLKKWKFSDVDKKALSLWDSYTQYKEKMFERTSNPIPWKVIKANRKTQARINALEYILNNIPYEIKDKELIKHTRPPLETSNAMDK